MSELDPTAMFRQEAAELLDSLEGTLLDLGNGDRILLSDVFDFI